MNWDQDEKQGFKKAALFVYPALLLAGLLSDKGRLLDSLGTFVSIVVIVTVFLFLIASVLPFKRAFYATLIAFVLSLFVHNPVIEDGLLIVINSTGSIAMLFFYALLAPALFLELVPVRFFRAVWPRLSLPEGNTEEIECLRTLLADYQKKLQQPEKDNSADIKNLKRMVKGYERQITQLDEEISDLEIKLQEQANQLNQSQTEYDTALKLLNLKDREFTKPDLNRHVKILRSLFHSDKFQGRTDTNGIFTSIIEAEKIIRRQHEW